MRVAVQDDIGGTVPSATTAITLSLADNPGNATLGGTLTANAVQGIATFADLVLNRAAAGYTLRAGRAQARLGTNGRLEELRYENVPLAAAALGDGLPELTIGAARVRCDRPVQAHHPGSSGFERLAANAQFHR